jgi:hypothetical protein
MKTNHTPGPWTVSDNAIYGSSGLIKPLIAFLDDRFADEEAANNARLIVTAPEMLDLLYKVLPFIEDAELDSTYKHGVVAEVTRQIRDTIQKAGGAL